MTIAETLAELRTASVVTAALASALGDSCEHSLGGAPDRPRSGGSPRRPARSGVRAAGAVGDPPAEEQQPDQRSESGRRRGGRDDAPPV
ncbi:hypothetical protein ASG06_05810 [Rathayibacter sp. Leaf185]|nr:hypothetical protein ASF42_05800 [Rathayibacter sp. Leaf294]KQS13900.1 hypothetical protein ASG06_05810 [Rathayibacter sp. Leaf185]